MYKNILKWRKLMFKLMFRGDHWRDFCMWETRMGQVTLVHASYIMMKTRR